MKILLAVLGILFIVMVYSYKTSPYRVQPSIVGGLQKPTSQPTRTDEEMKAVECVIAESNIEIGHDPDCSDFPFQNTAQWHYECSLELKGYDIFHLDGDRDGIACELQP